MKQKKLKITPATLFIFRRRANMALGHETTKTTTTTIPHPGASTALKLK